LDTFFHYINFKQIEVDPTIYIQVDDNDNFIILAIYVDDGIVVTPNLVLTSKLWTFLKKEFDMTYENNIYSIVGLHIIHDRINKWFLIAQDNYLNGVLHRYNMFNSNVISTPLEVGHKLSRDDSRHSPNEEEQMALVLYAQAMGSLMHRSVYIQDQTPHTLSTP